MKMSNESITRALVGLSNARQEVTETAVNYLFRIKLLAIRAFPDNKRVADSITLQVFKQGLQTQNSHINRARSIEEILNIIYNHGPHNYRRPIPNRNGNRGQHPQNNRIPRIPRAVVEDPTVQIVRIDPAQWPDRRRQSESEDEGVFEQ